MKSITRDRQFRIETLKVQISFVCVIFLKILLI